MPNVRECAAAVAAFAAGAAVGGLGALLLAPASGEETRRRMAERCRDQTGELLRKGRRAVDRAAQRLEDGIEDGRRRLADSIRA
jgi:gas vesicle protein